MAQNNTGSGGATAGQQVQMPLFYRQPMPLDPKRHGGYGFVSAGSYNFARDTNIIPILANEVAAAQRHYPIVFVGEAPTMAAVVGLREPRNLFVDQFGRWKDGAYIPAYVRRYPFLFSQMADAGKFALCIDEASGCLVEGDGQALFEGGQPTKFLQDTLKFCGEFQQEYERTRIFCQTLRASGLLAERTMRMQSPKAEPIAISGFHGIDEEKLAALPEQTAADWRRRGWFGIIYGHMLSTPSWRDLGVLGGQALPV